VKGCLVNMNALDTGATGCSTASSATIYPIPKLIVPVSTKPLMMRRGVAQPGTAELNC
jgi:hypothetical protein